MLRGTELMVLCKKCDQTVEEPASIVIGKGRYCYTCYAGMDQQERLGRLLGTFARPADPTLNDQHLSEVLQKVDPVEVSGSTGWLKEPPADDPFNQKVCPACGKKVNVLTLEGVCLHCYKEPEEQPSGDSARAYQSLVDAKSEQDRRSTRPRGKYVLWDGERRFEAPTLEALRKLVELWRTL